jgi:hypothetical protein
MIMTKSNTSEAVDAGHSDLENIVFGQSYAVRVVRDATGACTNTIFQRRVARTAFTASLQMLSATLPRGQAVTRDKEVTK